MNLFKKRSKIKITLILGFLLATNFAIANNNKPVEALSVKVGYTKADVKQTNNLVDVTLPTENAVAVNLEIFTKCDYLRNYNLIPFIDVNLLMNSDKRIYSLGLGVKKEIPIDSPFKPYVSVSAGYALLNWKTSPLVNVIQKDETSSSVVGSLQLGTTYKNFDFAIRYDRYNFDTKLNSGLATSMLSDKYALSALIGIIF